VGRSYENDFLVFVKQPVNTCFVAVGLQFHYTPYRWKGPALSYRGAVSKIYLFLIIHKD
jgi:hypothetical protein